MTPTLLDQCTAGAIDGSVPFPETIQKITTGGVEWYSANLIFDIKTYYGADLSHYQTPWPLSHSFHSARLLRLRCLLQSSIGQAEPGLEKL